MDNSSSKSSSLFSSSKSNQQSEDDELVQNSIQNISHKSVKTKRHKNRSTALNQEVEGDETDNIGTTNTT